jgi:hypothetical protein
MSIRKVRTHIPNAAVTITGLHDEGNVKRVGLSTNMSTREDHSKHFQENMRSTRKADCGYSTWGNEGMDLGDPHTLHRKTGRHSLWMPTLVSVANTQNSHVEDLVVEMQAVPMGTPSCAWFFEALLRRALQFAALLVHSGSSNAQQKWTSGRTVQRHVFRERRMKCLGERHSI